MKSVREADVRDKKVFVRVDFNVPMKEGKVIDPNRIKSAIPTVKFLMDKKAKIILGTHLGRPEGSFNSEFYTIPIAKELAKLIDKEVYATDHVTGQKVSEKIDQLKPGELLLLGNLRFDPREEKNDKEFGKELAGLADLYVNDAFAVCHRANASVEAITNFIPSYSGLLLESEMTTLNFFLKNPEHPFILIIGGAKIKDKTSLITRLAEVADKVLIGGAVANTFLAASGTDISKSLVDQEMVAKCKEILNKFASKIKIPEDFEKEILDGGDFKIFDIGPKTREAFVHEISYAKSIFWNGNLGYTEDERFRNGTRDIAKAIVKNPGNSVIAGGDTAGFLQEENLKEGITYISTGGSAAMEFLVGESMPGIEALNKATL